MSAEIVGNNDEATAPSPSSTRNVNDAVSGTNHSIQDTQDTQAGTASTPTWFKVLQFVAIYMIISNLTSAWLRPQHHQHQDQQQQHSRHNGEEYLHDGTKHAHSHSPSSLLYPAVQQSDLWSMKVYMSDSSTPPHGEHTQTPIFASGPCLFGDWDSIYSRVPLKISWPKESEALRNGSLYTHVEFCVHPPARTSSGQAASSSSCSHRFWYSDVITRHLPVRKESSKNLLFSGAEGDDDDNAVGSDAQLDRLVWTHVHPNITINVVPDAPVLQPAGFPPHFAKYMQPTSHNASQYKPIVFSNDFWCLYEDYTPLNKTVTHTEFLVMIEPLSMLKFQLYVQMSESFHMQQSLGTQSRSEVEVFKRMLLDNSPYFLALTFFVSILHSIFDFLAFKNDIQFWRQRDSSQGLSVRTLFMSIIMQIIILLYLIDQDTSFVITVSSGIGILIDMWKVTKASDVKLRWLYGVFPWVTLKDKPDYASETKKYDEEAFRYMSILLGPLVVAYAVYSLVYNSHRSWYSYIINMLAGAVYTFGFITMTPQLYINYKLKSVAHLPWRMLTYKALNTFVDDLFAFVIRMPTLHRLACFRDDVIFVVYLYQRWCYPVDHSRKNEFGVSGEQLATKRDDELMAPPASADRNLSRSDDQASNEQDECKTAVVAEKEDGAWKQPASLRKRRE